MLTCKEFLTALNEYLDESDDAQIRAEVEAHIKECPNCWVVFDTTQKTLKVFKDTEPSDFPPDIHARLMERIQRKIAESES